LKNKQSSNAGGDGNHVVERPVKKFATDEQKLKKYPKYNNQPAASNPSINNSATKLILVEHNSIDWSTTQRNAM